MHNKKIKEKHLNYLLIGLITFNCILIIFFFYTKVEVVKRVDANVDSQVIVHKEVPHVHKTKSVSFSTGGNFFNDIFNVSFNKLLFN